MAAAHAGAAHADVPAPPADGLALPWKHLTCQVGSAAMPSQTGTVTVRDTLNGAATTLGVIDLADHGYGYVAARIDVEVR